MYRSQEFFRNGSNIIKMQELSASVVNTEMA